MLVKKICPECLSMSYGEAANLYEPCQLVACVDKNKAATGFEHHAIQAVLVEVPADVHAPASLTRDHLDKALLALVRAGDEATAHAVREVIHREWDRAIQVAGRRQLGGKRDPAKLPEKGDVWRHGDQVIEVRERHGVLVEYDEWTEGSADKSRRYSSVRAACEAVGEAPAMPVWEDFIGGAVLKS